MRSPKTRAEREAEKQRRIEEHAKVCPEPRCHDEDDKRMCVFAAGSLHCVADPCPNPRHRA